MADFMIKNARIADGLGGEPFMGSVVCRNGVVSEVSRDIRGVSDTTGLEVVDADGLLLCPGFIDPHGHSDISILAAPDAEGKLSQGITTEICGNCGLSAFPLTDRNRDHLQELFARYEIPLNWNSFERYAELMRNAGPAINIATLCGHNTLRASVMGYDAKVADDREIRAMRSALKKALRGGRGENVQYSTSNNQFSTFNGKVLGVLGFSTGLPYSPGNSAAREELLALGAIVAESDSVLATHLRSEGNRLLESLDEFITIGKESGCRKLHVSHLKTAGEPNWGKLDDVLERLSRAESEGVRITADRYPYVESMTSLGAFTPSPFSEMDDSTLMESLRSPDGFARFAAAAGDMPESRWRSLRIVSTSANPAPAIFADASELRGINLAELAAAASLAPGEICARLLRDDAPGTTAASKGMSESNMRKILSLPFVCCCTDETARPADFSLGASHPR
ncbi:MAG: amidohydrolase family protein, partial [Kiritimatiellaeota bacterium]|nr:amidohydrolase family protein [Kiritimatiellota bacterium]